MKDKIDIELVTNSDNVNFSDLAEFSIGLKITNNNPELVHVDVSEIALYVNGNRSVVWDLAVQNGTIINLKINANSEKEIKWPMGDALFYSPGSYRLSLVWDNRKQEKSILIK